LREVDNDDDYNSNEAEDYGDDDEDGVVVVGGGGGGDIVENAKTGVIKSTRETVEQLLIESLNKDKILFPNLEALALHSVNDNSINVAKQTAEEDEIQLLAASTNEGREESKKVVEAHSGGGGLAEGLAGGLAGGGGDDGISGDEDGDEGDDGLTTTYLDDCWFLDLSASSNTSFIAAPTNSRPIGEGSMGEGPVGGGPTDITPILCPSVCLSKNDLVLTRSSVVNELASGDLKANHNSNSDINSLAATIDSVAVRKINVETSAKPPGKKRDVLRVSEWHCRRGSRLLVNQSR